MCRLHPAPTTLIVTSALVLAALASAGCASGPYKGAAPRTLVTGSLIAPPAPPQGTASTNPMLRSYSNRQLQNTLLLTPGQALQQLDPSVTLQH